MDSSFFDILKGYSKLFASDGKEFFYKHPTIYEYESDAQYKDEYSREAKALGLKSEKELLAEAVSYKVWDNDKDIKIKKLKSLSLKQQQAISKINEPSVKKLAQESFDETLKEMNELITAKEKLIVFSLERYVERKTNTKMFLSFLFSDEKFLNQIDEDSYLDNVIVSFRSKYEDLSNRDLSLKRAYYGSFFELFSLYHNNPFNIFGKNIYELTIFQKNLMVYASILKSKLDNIPNIPDGVKEDGVLLFNYVPAKAKNNEEEEFSTRNFVSSKGGLENMKESDKL